MTYLYSDALGKNYCVVFCFEVALFICPKNVWNFPRQSFLMKRSDILL